jgi:hypothetical protein
MPQDGWLEVLRAGFPENFFEANRQAFLIGRQNQEKTRTN